MKRIIKLLLAAVILLPFTGCSKESNKPEPEKETLKTVPAGFYRDYQEADFNKYNSPVSENGLGGTKIWIEGSYDEVLELDTDDTVIYYITFKSIDDHEWLVLLDTKQTSSITRYKQLTGHRILIIGRYEGYSGVYEMPVVDLISIYDRKTGSITASVAFSDSSTETNESDTTDPQNNDPQNNNGEKTGSIRTEIKEAIDSYEAFIDEYIEFMTKYEKSGNDVSMLADYVRFVAKLADFEAKMSTLEKGLNDAEDIYFMEVMHRCNLKMLKALD